MSGTARPAARRDLAQEYRSALREYVSGAGEAALASGYELGRKAATQSIGVLDLAVLHHEALLELDLGGGVEPSRLARAGHFFAESLSPFEMTLRALEERTRALIKARGDYQDLYDHAPDMHVSADARTATIITCNQTLSDKLGHAREELVGRPLLELYHPSCLDDLRRALHVFSIEGHVENVKLTARSRSGSRIPVLLNVSAVRDHRGAIVQSRSALRDISDYVEMEARKAAMFDGALDAIVTIDEDGRILEFNPAAEAMFGCPAAAAVGTRLAEIVALPQAHPGALAAAAGSGAASLLGRRLELSAVRRNGEAFPAEVSIVRLRATELPVLTAFIRDLTDLKHAQNELRQTIVDLERSNADLEQFAYLASHDLQEPLRMVACYVELLERAYRGKLDDRADAFIGFAVDGAQRMKRRIDGLLAYCRVDSYGNPFEPVACRDIVDNALRGLALLIQETGADITCGDLPRLWVDPLQIEHVFHNLLTNAIKYRRDAVPRIEIRAAQQPGAWWEFSVKDNGIGFDEQFALRIFQMFQRLHDAGKYEGDGIGLSIAKRIIERHGGRIWARSAPGTGSTFHFTLPARTAGKAPQGDAS